MENLPVKIPTLQDLIEQDEKYLKDNQLAVLLNQPPPEKWLQKHPILTGHKYLPIERVEYLLTRIFTKWWVEVLDSKIIANSVVVTVRLFVIDPISKEVKHNDGIGAAPIQTDAKASATDWTKVKAAGVQMAAPMAKSYAFKDAAESFGKLFGKDASRKNQIDYNDLLKTAKAPEEHLADRVAKLLQDVTAPEDLDQIRADLGDDVTDEIDAMLVDKYAELMQ